MRIPVLIHQCEQEPISCVGTGIKHFLNLLVGEHLWLSLFPFEGNSPRVFWLRLGNAVQERFVSPPVWHG